MAYNGGSKSACGVVMKKHEGKKPLGMPKHRWEDNIKVDTKDIGWKNVGHIHLAKVRTRMQALLDKMNLWVPQNAGNVLTTWETISF